jgi:hypothetical protein
MRRIGRINNICSYVRVRASDGVSPLHNRIVRLRHERYGTRLSHPCTRIRKVSERTKSDSLLVGRLAVGYRISLIFRWPITLRMI